MAYGRYGIRRMPTTFNLGYDHRLGNLRLRGTLGWASPRGSRDRGCATYGDDCWVSLHLFINGTCCKEGTTIVVDRSSYLTVQPNLRAVRCQHALAT